MEGRKKGGKESVALGGEVGKERERNRGSVSGLIRKCGHKPISLDPPGSRTKQDRIILFP